MQPFLIHSNPNPSQNAALTEAFEPLLSAEDAAKLLGGIHPKTLMRKARTGEIPGYQFARSWFFRASELNRWLASCVRLTPANAPA